MLRSALRSPGLPARDVPPAVALQRRVEGDIHPSPRLAIKQRAGGNALPRHLFEAQALRAKLHLVRPVLLGLAALELHRKGRLAIRPRVKFHEIGDPDEVQPLAGERQRRNPPHTLDPPHATTIGGEMQNVALGGEPVVRPQALQMDQSRLPQAVDGVLGMGSVGVISILSARKSYSRSMISTPSGRPSRSMVTA